MYSSTYSLFSQLPASWGHYDLFFFALDRGNLIRGNCFWWAGCTGPVHHDLNYFLSLSIGIPMSGYN